jgi:hypothetical protein
MVPDMERRLSRTMVRIIELLRDGPPERAEIADALRLGEPATAAVLTAMQHRQIVTKEGHRYSLAPGTASMWLQAVPVPDALHRADADALHLRHGGRCPVRRLATLPPDVTLERIVDQAKMRWRIERDCLELKQEVGLCHYEGHGWRGFHHHATLCIAAYGFLISEKETFPPSGHPRTWRGTQSSLPVGHRPRGSPAAFATPDAELNRNIAYPPRAHFGTRTATMSLPRTDASEGRAE